MEPPTKPLRGMAIIRQLVVVKKQAQLDAVENYRNTPEIRAAYEQLSRKNKQNRDREQQSI